MTEQEQKERQAQLNVNVRENGTVEGHVVETYLAMIYALHFPQQYSFDLDFENKFIAFTIDSHGVDQEVRLPFELVTDMKKWIDDGPRDDVAESGGGKAAK